MFATEAEPFACAMALAMGVCQDEQVLAGVFLRENNFFTIFSQLQGFAKLMLKKCDETAWVIKSHPEDNVQVDVKQS